MAVGAYWRRAFAGAAAFVAALASIPGHRAGASTPSPGSPVPTFGTRGVSVDTAGGAQGASGVALDPSTGDLIAVGTAAGSAFAVARFTDNGHVDPSYGGGTVVSHFPGTAGSEAEAVATYPASSPLAGDAVVVGTAITASGGRELAVARYTASGHLDASFGSGGLVTEAVGSGSAEDDELDSVAIGSSGTIVAAGSSLGGDSAEPNERALVVIELQTSGAPVASFGTKGVAVDPVGQSLDPGAAVAIDSSGRPVVVGSAVVNSKGANDVVLCRLTSTGTLDPSFGRTGAVFTSVGSGDDYGSGVAIQPNGAIVVAGSTYDSAKDASNGFVLRYTPAGSLDSSFGSAGVAANSGANAFQAVAVESDGKVLAAGYVNGTHGTEAVAVERLEANGSPDSSFGNGGLSVSTPNGGSSTADAIALDPADSANTNVVVGGPISTGSGPALGLEELVGGGAPLPPASAGPTSVPVVYPDTTGYVLGAADGGVFAYGTAAYHGSAGAAHLTSPIVGLAPTPNAGGYWLVTSDGRVFSYGDATYHGSTVATRLPEPIVGMAATRDGKGYWLVGSDGRVYSYGDAAFHGSAAAVRLTSPIVGMAATPDGKGYWLVGSDGRVLSYGDATTHGSALATHLTSPIVGMAATPDGKGYWLVGSNGRVLNYGDAAFHGSALSTHLAKPIVGMAASPDGKGYWLVGAGGGIFSYGDAVYEGSAGGTHLAAPIVGMAR